MQFKVNNQRRTIHKASVHHFISSIRAPFQVSGTTVQIHTGRNPYIKNADFWEP